LFIFNPVSTSLGLGGRRLNSLETWNFSISYWWRGSSMERRDGDGERRSVDVAWV
jgi:hypothetical protein